MLNFIDFSHIVNSVIISYMHNCSIAHLNSVLNEAHKNMLIKQHGMNPTIFTRVHLCVQLGA